MSNTTLQDTYAKWWIWWLHESFSCVFESKSLQLAFCYSYTSILPFCSCWATSKLQGWRLSSFFILHPVADSFMMWLQCPQPHHKVPSWNSDIQQPCQQLLSQSYENKQEIEAFHSEFETNVIVIRLTEDQEKAFHLFKLKKKNLIPKSQSLETKDNNTVNIHLQVSWFTLRALMSYTIHTKCSYYFEEMCKLSFNKQCSHALWCWLLEKYTVRNICMYTSKRSTSTHAVWALADPFA